MTQVRDIGTANDPAVEALYRNVLGSPIQVVHDRAYDLRMLPALVVDGPDGPAGALAYDIADGAMEVVAIVADPPGGGVGSALMRAAVEKAGGAGLHRIWLVTTNDNLGALRFYQRRGLRIVGIDRGAVDRARRLKPTIKTVGVYGIPLHDELILELNLHDSGPAPAPSRDPAGSPETRRPDIRR
jgi:GNAT superfamily N-acetyltransferase